MRNVERTFLAVIWALAPLAGRGALAADGHPRAHADAVVDAATPARPARQDLVGAWRLVRIEYAGRRGETVDPFYQAGSVGIIIYDASGWMSVQIAAPNRRVGDIAATRVPVAEGDAGSKASAFDTYYSYYGTWDFDPRTSVVTHHLEASLIPAETGLSYPQIVTFENGLLVFTVVSRAAGAETVRRKLWARQSPASSASIPFRRD